MIILRALLSRVSGLLGRRHRDTQLNEEIHVHLELLIEEHLRRGMSLHEARAAARREFGGVDQIKETYRDQRGLPVVDALVRDIQYAVRGLRRAPVFTSAAILSLALGIGANAAVFSVMNAALMRELPVEDPQRLVSAYWRNVRVSSGPGSRGDFSYPMFRDLAGRQTAFSEMAASDTWRLNRFRMDGAADDESAVDIDAGIVSANYFSMLGVSAAIGRVFTPSDSSAPGEGAVVVLGDGFWSRRFGRDPSVVGRTMYLNNVPFTILGVAPRGFFGDRVGAARDFWIPLLMQPRLSPVNQLERRTATWFKTVARLKPGVSEARAEAELTGLYQQLLAQENASGTGSLMGRPNPSDRRVEIDQGSQALNNLRGRFEQPLRVLMGVVGLVLLIACCNVANLLLARGSSRQREIAIRLAMGSSRRRLVGQLMTESMLLALFGGLAGLIVATATGDILVSTLSIGVLDLPVDARVLGFTASLATLTTLLFGLVPALRATRVAVTPSLQASSKSLAGSGHHRIANTLVITQVALTLCLLVGAGLLVRTLQNLRRLDIGVDRGHLMTVTLLTDTAAIADVPRLRQDLIERARRIRGVEGVGVSTGQSLFLESMTTSPVRVPDSDVNPAQDRDVRQEWVSPDYFGAVGMAVVRGRMFRETDSETAPRVVIINETTARHYFASGNPLGHLMYFPKLDAQNRYIPFSTQPPREEGVEIVGVVRDVKDVSLRQAPRKMAFVPLAQRREAPSVGYGNLVALGVIHLRVTGDPGIVAAEMRGLLKQIHPRLGIRRISTLEADISRTLARELMMSRLIGFFGVLALLLACVGLYGLMACMVTRRTGEIGLRMALGAKQLDVARMVLRETVRLVVAGIVLGIPAALATTRLIESLLFGVESTDLGTIATVALLMLLVAGIAGVVPAKRAAQVDPMVALRAE